LKKPPAGNNLRIPEKRCRAIHVKDKKGLTGVEKTFFMATKARSISPLGVRIMSDRELLEEISDTAFDPGLKATAIRDRIRDLLAEAGYAEEEEEADEGDEE
jgi:hypothetical protein